MKGIGMIIVPLLMGLVNVMYWPFVPAVLASGFLWGLAFAGLCTVKR